MSAPSGPDHEPTDAPAPRAVRLPPALLATLGADARLAYPQEACALLVGRVLADGTAVVDRAARGPNRAAQPDRFEIDVGLHLRLQRSLRDSGDGRRIVGVWHSHPDHPAQPSAADAAGAWEAGLVWLITTVRADAAGETRAFLALGEEAGFAPLPLSA